MVARGENNPGALRGALIGFPGQRPARQPATRGPSGARGRLEKWCA